ncbi:HlyD family type I secretion periplasmic adaptor subunit [Shimia abyssi]|uniref:Membrane fusion protein (MFP) family protein n=1 Tax=Shimia abyssi TaxID=1662395 RepID=A0A2P8F764_9RHOB|nr:HlyD family type I secretion periplasmic adaptor subunit [Shimia abyssi]PSL17558.1 HlyD family secretion protein [Shimia abyssi]
MSEEHQKWSVRMPVFVGGIALVLLVGGFGYWAFTSQLAGAVVTSGRLEVDQKRQVVQHPDGGVVSDILVDEGDKVEAGATLVLLDGALLNSELIIVEGQLYELMARRARLGAERDKSETIKFEDRLLKAAAQSETVSEVVNGQVALFNTRKISIEQEVSQLRKRQQQIGNQIEGLDAQMEALVLQLQLIKEELADQQVLLDKGLAQASRVLALRREEAGLKGRIGELIASRAESEGRITETDIQVLRIETQNVEEAISRLRDLRYQEIELIERRNAILERLDRLEIRAPVAGIIYDLQVFADRSVIQSAQPVLYVVPLDSPLVISARIETINVDEVFPGQPVRLRFSSFNSRTTPELDGQIVRVSPDAFTDENTGQSYYMAEIVPLDGELAKLAELEIIPGMPVETFIQTKPRTPIAYLVQPFMEYFNKAFRES